MFWEVGCYLELGMYGLVGLTVFSCKLFVAILLILLE